ncbi:endolytic transglycosylase MltG [Streptomyces sp. Caat 7-52]|uniref:endolytic transglycosylase MltG n=1 Tax=Streptomyces sp. Caat 7-52 TaxID=2949637 RepID=UPI002034D156|nr:endolytic transglycosylase MltG [Streptomyces sp. Caat 7-52]
MQTKTPSRSRIRLTRRGRLAVVVAGAVVAGTAVAVPLLMLAADHEQAKTAMLVIPEGWRASQVYAAIDKALELPPGSTRKSLGKAALQLPSQAGGNPEGYLRPATYPVRQGATPESLLRTMVETANRRYSAAPVAAGAQREAMNVYQTVTIASIVQAEADTKVDMGKVARVILNRLQRGMPLQMDATINYALNRNTVGTGQDDTQIASPYNSYQRVGLPPTPIDNPGEQAMRAVLNPTPGDWLYFVTVKPGDTRFTADYDEHLRNVAEFSAAHQSAATQPSGGGPPGPPYNPSS